ncbi:propane monooxygenase reductase subunit [Panacagrimonas perspica]|uniref:Propane monooxygenase reductase subunit n=1 Tax=Panacagrimonas perspica TaxID=381431 RepID=A0A4R7PA87_9GAMM|nr:2Fe-2S iron-sulfur cluster-binding protein [Panacagrimonas perspica]TDU30944.1 propane monooxygenase reductase subunit [Panacagrimonas perspica]THD01905.1 hypothetical protein B1810_18065 [Panacagrimonas perspica]
MSGATFNVEFTPSGETFDVSPGETVLDAALRQGVQIRYGCRAGKCSTCKFQIEDGEIDHGDVSVYSLPDAERDEGWGLLCRARPLTDLLIRDNRPPDLRVRPLLPPREIDARIAGVRSLTPELVELRLTLDEPLDFYAGQFVDLGLRHHRSPDEVREGSSTGAGLPDFVRATGGAEPVDAIWRSYSIATPPSSRFELSFVIKRIAGGAFSSRVGDVSPGAAVRLRGPYGDGYLRAGDRPVLMCAIGSGIAPILSMLHEAAETKDPRPFLFYYGARSAADVPHHAEIAALFANGLAPGSKFVPTLDGIDANDPWTGERGNVTQAIQRGVQEQAHLCDAYLCGAPPMCDAVARLLQAKGLSEQSLFMDRFFATSKSEATTTI